DVRFDGFGALGEVRPPLVGVAADEAVEIVESEAGGPAVERPGLAGLPVRDVVVLAEPRGAVAVLLEDLGSGRRVPAHDGVVPGEPGARLHDARGVDRVVVAAGEDRRPGGGTQGGGVELVVAQPGPGLGVERRRVARTAERAG